MNEHKNIITIEDEIKEFSDKPVKSSALYKKVKELESNAVPDASEASVGDVLTKGEDGIGWSAPSGGGSYYEETTVFDGSVTFSEGAGDTGEPAPQNTNDLIVSIDGGENVTLVWGDGYWHDEDNTIEAHEDSDTLWLYVSGISDGTHSAHVTSNGLNPDFAQAVNDAVDIPSASNVPNIPEDTYYAKSLAARTNRFGKPSGWEEILPSRSPVSSIDNKQYIVSGTKATLKYRELFNNGPWQTSSSQYVILRRYVGPQSDESPIFDQCAIDDIPDRYLDQSVTYSLIKLSDGMQYGWTLNFPPCNEAMNGTYTLKCTVSNGTKTYTWVLDS